MYIRYVKSVFEERESPFSRTPSFGRFATRSLHAPTLVDLRAFLSRCLFTLNLCLLKQIQQSRRLTLLLFFYRSIPTQESLISLVYAKSAGWYALLLSSCLSAKIYHIGEPPKLATTNMTEPIPSLSLAFNALFHRLTPRTFCSW